MERVTRLASQRAVVIFSLSSCCLCHSMKAFFSDLGVSYDVHELDQAPNGKQMLGELAKLVGRKTPVPVVFVGGRLLGSMDKVMSLHLRGELLVILRSAGAIWLLPSKAGYRDN